MSNSTAPNNPVIKHIAIAGLRGIRKGLIENFAPISILVGPNGCGKSTVLDALMLGGAAMDDPEFKSVRSRRPHLAGDDSQFFWNDEANSVSSVQIVTWNHTGLPLLRAWQTRRLPGRSFQWQGRWTLDRDTAHSEIVGLLPVAAIRDNELQVYDFAIGTCHFRRAPNKPDSTIASGLLPEIIALYDSADRIGQTDLVTKFSQSIRSGGLEIVRGALATLLPNFLDIRIIVDPPDRPNPFIVVAYKNSVVHLSMEGEGIQALVRIVAELAKKPGSLVMLEEPEAHLHPRAIREVCRAISIVSSYGIQVVISTHSTELIDALLAQHANDRLDDVAIYKLGLKDGELSSVRFSGSSAAALRDEIGEDLR